MERFSLLQHVMIVVVLLNNQSPSFTIYIFSSLQLPAVTDVAVASLNTVACIDHVTIIGTSAMRKGN